MNHRTFFLLVATLFAACDRTEAPNVTVSPIRPGTSVQSLPDVVLLDASHR